VAAMATTGNRWPDQASPEVNRPPLRRRRRVVSGPAAGARPRDDDNPAKELVASHAVAARRVARAAPEIDAGMYGATQVAQSVAHEFNNILSVVLGNLQLLQRRTGKDQRIRSLVGPAIDAALRGSDLTKRLLAYAHRRELEPRPVDINAAVVAMADAIRRTTGPDIEVTMRLADSMPTIETDLERLESAILNLAANAREAMPAGGTLTIETAQVAIGETTAARSPAVKAGTYACISVCDTGGGMAPDLVDRAFEPFFSTKPVGKGSGLGLSQVLGFVKQSGGYTTVSSKPGRGARFRIFLLATSGSAYPGLERGVTTT
jgi:signal transduction histidine kinase